MTLAALCCTRQSQSLVSTAACQNLTLTFDLDPWRWPTPLTLTIQQGNSDVKTWFMSFDLVCWPTTLTYNPNLAKVRVDLQTEYEGQRWNGSSGRVQTDTQMDGQTDGRYQVHYLPALLSYVVDNQGFHFTIKVTCNSEIHDDAFTFFYNFRLVTRVKHIGWAVVSHIFLEKRFLWGRPHSHVKILPT